jgi:hypothetical protein
MGFAFIKTPRARVVPARSREPTITLCVQQCKKSLNPNELLPKDSSNKKSRTQMRLGLQSNRVIPVKQNAKSSFKNCMVITPYLS